jgi:hypothetical protein
LSSVPTYVDRVLESLLRSMLAKEPKDRPDIRTIQQHDWCRKRFPRTGKVALFFKNALFLNDISI